MKNYMENNNKDLKDFRYERKFIISELNKFEIEYLIKHHPAMFSEIFYERNVNNIYFDSENLKNYHSNLAGNSQRLKIRIRWYGKLSGFIKNPVLEIKIKENQLGRKLSFPLKSFILNKKFSIEFLQKEVLEKSNLPAWLVEKLRIERPNLLNTYRRKYFISFDKKYRVTLDKDMVFFKIRNKNNLFNEKITFESINVLELKYLYEFSKNAEKITNYFPFRLSAISKYVSGIDLLNIS